MRNRANSSWILATLMFVIGSAAVAPGQIVPWDVYDDPDSGSVCDVVNASNAELVVLASTGELVIVSGVDRILVGTFVEVFGVVLPDGTISLDGADVYLDSSFAGTISFETDADGFETLWWTTLNGFVVGVDGFTGEPFESNFFPSDFEDVPCDACDFWDDPTDCVVVDPSPGFRLCGVDVVLPSTVLLASLGLISAKRRRIPFERFA